MMTRMVVEYLTLEEQDSDSFEYQESAIIDNGARIGRGSKIWHFVHVCKGAKIGKNCSIGQGCYIGPNVVIGDNVRIQNNVSVYEGVIIGADCFIGPSVVFTNCHLPVPGTKQPIDKTVIGNDCVIGANATIIAPCEIAMCTIIGAGSVVTSGSYEPHTFVGNPAKPK